MDVKKLRAKYIEMLNTLTLFNIKDQQVLDFAANPEYRLPLNMSTIHLMDILCKENNLSKDEARWLRDTWLY